MKHKSIRVIVFVGVSLSVLMALALAAQDKFTLKAPNGIAFSEFRGYEGWENVAPSQTDDGLKIITANPVMIKVYKESIPDNGKPFPEGSAIAKIE